MKNCNFSVRECQGPCLRHCTSDRIGLFIIMFMLSYLCGYKVGLYYKSKKKEFSHPRFKTQ